MRGRARGVVFPRTPGGLPRPVLCTSSPTKGETEAPRGVGRAGWTSGPAAGAVVRPLCRGGPLGFRVSSGKRLAGLVGCAAILETDDSSPLDGFAGSAPASAPIFPAAP
nr:hypothetical protein [Homo sapiens]